MASLYSSSSSSNPFLAPKITQEEFKTFHNIDRELFTRLVFNLNRDPAQSMQVMAFWLWLERASHANNLVFKMLSLPDTLIGSMADEAVICLNCVENDKYHFTPDFAASIHHDHIPLTHCVTKTGLTLQFFHENRLTVLRALTRIVHEVCLRAFDDILKEVDKMKIAVAAAGHETRNKQAMMKPFGFYGPTMNPAVPVLYNHQHQLGAPQVMSGGAEGGYSGNFMHGFDTYDLTVQRQVLNNEIGDVLSRIQIFASHEEDKDSINVPVDDRTIFLTFSKGYPISEDEVRDFFTRKYGDCIEAIHMQEVMVEDHQPLYARLIVRLPALIEVVLEGKSKAKFSINGKHVWARKYVKKNPRMSSSVSPPQPASPSQPTSPAAP